MLPLSGRSAWRLGRAMTRASKLLPPRRPATFLQRALPAQRLDRARDYRLTTVVAGAGFGKSTLLGPWISALQGCWYTIDKSDASPATLARGLVDSLRVKVPSLSTDERGPSGFVWSGRGCGES